MGQSQPLSPPPTSSNDPLQIITSLNPEVKKSTMVEIVKQLSPQDQQTAMVESMKQLSPQTQQAVADQTGLTSPSKNVNDTLWLIIVTSFAIVLVGTFLSLAIGVVGIGRSTTDLQLLLTVFTTAVGFLGGLLTPSPARSGSG